MKLEEINALYETATSEQTEDSQAEADMSWWCDVIALQWSDIYRELMAARDLFSHCKFTGDETSETHHALIGRVPVVELDLYVAARKENDQ